MSKADPVVAEKEPPTDTLASARNRIATLERELEAVEARVKHLEFSLTQLRDGICRQMGLKPEHLRP